MSNYNLVKSLFERVSLNGFPLNVMEWVVKNYLSYFLGVLNGSISVLRMEHGFYLDIYIILYYIYLYIYIYYICNGLIVLGVSQFAGTIL